MMRKIVPTLLAVETLQGDNEFENPVLNRSHRTLAGDTIFMRWHKFVHKFLADSVHYLDLRRGPTDVAQTHPRSPADTNPGGILTTVHRVGLPIPAGTDVGAPVMDRWPPGFAIHAELAIYVTAGLTPSQALQAATLNPAMYLHGTDSLGTVASGKLADLVLLDADPLQDITNTMTIRAVVANGRYFDRAALDQLLAGIQARAKQEPQPLGQAR
jgi:cytosine/adenosine deaminase-related metal-dependent hydrolase